MPAGWRTALGVALGTYLAVLAVNRSLVTVRGPSMEPALWPGDRLLTVPSVPALLTPGRVVVVDDPTDPGHLVVKRLHTVDAVAVVVRGDAADRSTDSSVWGPLPRRAVRRIAVARWPDLRTPLRRQPGRRATTSSSGSSSPTSPASRRP